MPDPRNAASPRPTLTLDALPDPAWLCAPGTLAILHANARAAALQGRRPDAAGPWPDLLDQTPAEEAARLRADLARTRPGETVEILWRRADHGAAREFDMRLTPVGDGPDAAVLAVAREVVSRPRPAPAPVPAAADLLGSAGWLAAFGGWRIDLRTGALTWTDGGAVVEAGRSAPALNFEEGLAFFDPRDHGRILEAYHGCILDGVAFDETLSIKTVEGTTRWFRVLGAPEREDGRIVAARGAFQDIDDLIQAHRRNEALEHRLRRVLETSTQGVLLLDADERISFLNRAAAALLGQPGAAQGRRLTEVLPVSFDAAFAQGCRDAAACGEERAFEIEADDGRRLDVRIHPSPEGLLVQMQDITGLHRAQEDLRASEERLRLATDYGREVIWEYDVATRRLWWNEQLARQFGHASPTAPASPAFWIGLIPAEDRAPTLARIRAAWAGGDEDWRCDHRFLRADGTAAQVLNRAVILRDEAGRPRRLIGSLLDVTERIELEARLLEGRKLEAIGRLTGGLAHDFNNLLTIVVGAAERLADSPLDAASRRDASDALEAATRGAALIRQLLAFARRQPMEARRVDLRGLVENVTAMLSRTVEAPVVVSSILEDDLPAISIDPVQLETALLNLALNARDAQPGGGAIRIRAERCRMPADPGHETPGAPCVRLAVEDDGPGMTEEVRRKAFEPFFTTRAADGGTGLGLSTVYGFIRQSGGDVRIRTAPGAGCRVELHLPVGPAAAPDGESASVAAPPPAPGPASILVVEDDPRVRSQVVRRIAALGHQVESAPDAASALARLRTGPPVDLLFTDVLLAEGMSGPDLARAARRLRPGLRVLFTSGYPEVGAAAQPTRPAPLLAKPYRRPDLSAALAAALAAQPVEDAVKDI